MPKVLTDKEYGMARQLIDKVVEPKLADMVKALNEHLKKHGFVAIANVEWEFHPVKEEGGDPDA